MLSYVGTDYSALRLSPICEISSITTFPNTGFLRCVQLQFLDDTAEEHDRFPACLAALIHTSFISDAH